MDESRLSTHHFWGKVLLGRKGNVDMDVVSAVVTALALGASARTTTTAVQDAYAALTNLLRERYPRVSLSQLEEAPGSKARRAVLEEDLTSSHIYEDKDVVTAAHQLIEEVQKYSPGAARDIGIDLGDLTAGEVRLSNITTSGGGIKVDRVTIDGDVTIRGIIAHPDYQPPR